MAKTKKFATSTGKRNPNVKRKVVSMRVKQELSWAKIAAALEIAPRTARKIFDEAQGEGAHFDHRPLPGGRPHPCEHKGTCLHDEEEVEQAA